MARYTDIDKLIAEYDRVHSGALGGARKLMVEAPIADVAPRAEVEELQAECNKWQERLKTECEYAEAITKKKVAREIFAEIEKIIEKHHSECYEYEDGDECDTAITYISYLSVDIDDLKKKYTEGQK